MTRLLMIDPGKNTGATLGYYDAVTPFQLLERFQIHDGLDGFLRWTKEGLPEFDEIGCEKFRLSPQNKFAAELQPVEIEGAIRALQAYDHRFAMPIMWQERTTKGDLVDYPAAADTKYKRQKVRWEYLDKFGLYRKGTEFDDSNDTTYYSISSLVSRHHDPTIKAYVSKGKRRAAAVWNPGPGGF